MSIPTPTQKSASPSLEQAKYRSPKRCLVASFRKSRDRWKAKAQQRNTIIKTLKVRVYDLEQSRKHDRQQTQQTESKCQQLQTDLEQMRAKLDEQARQGEEKKRPSQPSVREEGNSLSD